MTGTFPEFSGQESMQFVLEAAELVAADTGIGGELSPPPGYLFLEHATNLLQICIAHIRNLRDRSPLFEIGGYDFPVPPGQTSVALDENELTGTRPSELGGYSPRLKG